MIELLFGVCMVAMPDECSEHRLVYYDMTAEDCLMRAQPKLARWIESHPGLRITRWRCRNADLSGERI